MASINALKLIPGIFLWKLNGDNVKVLSLYEDLHHAPISRKM